MKECKYCKSEIPDDATVCAHCGKSQNGGNHVGLGILIAVIGIMLMLSGTGMLESCSSPTLTLQGELELTPIN